MSKLMENCRFGGCSEGKANGTACQHCGFDKDEHERRKKLPLVRCEDGLVRMSWNKRDRDYRDK